MPKQTAPKKTQPDGHNGAAQHVILIRGARVHNLKNISLDLPRNRLIVFTGVSGSGKSSLAFDTIYAEGQRRYVESLSSYARQFLERMDKPDVDLIQGISPAMAIEQKANTRNPRSTVGTTTEVYDYLRLLFARVGKTYCLQCSKLVTRDSVQTVFTALNEETDRVQSAGSAELKLIITFPLPIHPKETLADALANLQKEGFFRVIIGRDMIDLGQTTVPPKTKPSDVQVLVDRLVFRPGEENGRIADSIETAFASGNGRALVVLADSQRTLHFNQNFECPSCNIHYEEPDPRMFSFNSPFGACPECQGFGRAVGIDMNLVVPDRGRTLRKGAIQPWTTPKFVENLSSLVRIAPTANVRLDVPFSELTGEELEVVMNGFDNFDGILGFFKRIEKKAYKIYYRVFISRYRGYTTCTLCGGARLRQEARNVKIDGQRISDIVQMTIADARQFFRTLDLSHYEVQVSKRILEELRKRLNYLDEVGIGYLTLDRLSSTLSGGESQRINLATSLGSSLVGALYVLDEPSIGLHPRDNARLIRILKALRDAGNTVIVVEHDADMMRASDVIVDLGPRAGEHGGQVVFNGSPEAILADQTSITGKYLSGQLAIPIPPRRRKSNGMAICVRGARENNLNDITVHFPLGMLLCVTGVSGSGKSTLVHDILYSGLRRLKGDFSGTQGTFKAIEGHELISAVELVDQSPIGRTPRSNPVTYIGVFDQIRNLFAATQAAKIHGFTPGHFSFNVPGGRCEACEGDGVVKIEMQFLADLYLVCDVCKGKRYKREVLEIKYRGKGIDDILSMTVSEAMKFFDAEATGRRVARRLRVLDDVGLGYIRLGQSAPSLSGGEAQRIKLAAHLASPQSDKHTLFLFDEPTTGLHFDDIAKLIACFNALIEAGNSIIIVEHNLDVIKCADYIIDLGPEAGREGGRIVAEGTPEELARIPESHTGRFLRSCLMLNEQSLSLSNKSGNR
jgi:excinuclease ABC subunit A